MAIYRYSFESIDSLSRKMQGHHVAAFVIFIAAVCAAGVTLLELRAALIYDAIFCLAMAAVLVRG